MVALPTKNGKLPINGDASQPEFVTRSGVVLALKPIKAMLIALFDEHYRGKFPPPTPPLIKLENGDMYPDAANEWYRTQYARWVNRYNLDSTQFMFEAGVLTDVPADFTSPFASETRSLKFIWLSTEVLDSHEIELLTEAITSLDAPTAQAVEQAEKN